MYQKSDVTKLNMDEFGKEIAFSQGIPLIILDFLESVCDFNFIEDIKINLFPSPIVNIMSPSDEEYQQFKIQISEDFFNNNMLEIFNKLGQLNFNES